MTQWGGLEKPGAIGTVRGHRRGLVVRVGLPLLLSLALAGGLAGRVGRVTLAFALLTVFVFYLGGVGLRWVWRRRWRLTRLVRLVTLAGLVTGAGLYVWLSLWVLRPDLLPQRVRYDFISNRHVTERLVDPALLKVERWEILGQEREVLFVHPAPAGYTALVYPVRIESRTRLRADLAVAPEAWSAEGDGVIFSIYAEDEAGMHLLYSRYVDPKHHQQDRHWLPLEVDLASFSGKLVRLIMVVGSGPAGDQRYDWAGWGEPRLERPTWP